jgi:hypothetical protein
MMMTMTTITTMEHECKRRAVYGSVRGKEERKGY